jgi:cell division control protein 42
MGWWDTAGPEDYDRLRPLSYPQTDVFLVCFDVMNGRSFESVPNKWIPEVRKHCPGTPIVLVGTQIDRRNDPKAVKRILDMGRKIVTPTEGFIMAKKQGCVAYHEVSALQHTGLRDLMTICMVSGAYASVEGKSKEKKDCLLQ